MCGICGFAGFQDRDLLLRMTDIMSYRGPDDSGYYFNEQVSLGHRRLSIIDLAQGHQPMHNEDKSIWIVFNGEIYNFKELRADLIKKGHIFYSNCDTEVIIHLYEDKKEGCIEKLNGMFTFAIWDEKDKKLLLARDRLGIKPLYYTYFNGKILFASEIKAIIQDNQVRKKVNLRALHRYFTFSFQTGSETLLEDIVQVSPGHFVTFQNEQIRITKYWHTLENRDTREKPEQYYTERLREYLFQSVNKRLISDVPLGLTLSGGIDSCSVLSMMAKITTERIKTFTIGYGQPDDELQAANLVAKQFKTEHHECIVDFSEITKSLPKIIWHLEEPIGNYVIATTYYLGKFIKEFVTVTLIGEGSDELFAGYTRYKIFSSYLRFIPPSLRNRLFLHPGYFCLSQKEIFRLYSNDISSKVKKIYRVDKDYSRYFKDSSDQLNNALLFDIKNQLPNNQLIRIDKLMMASSVEARVPFLDHNLVAFAQSIPPKLKIKGMKEKYILRKAMSRELPKAIYNRPKGASQYILRTWFDKGLKNLVSEFLTRKKIEERGYFNWDYVNKIITKKDDRLNPVTKMTFEMQLWLLLVFEIWHQIFID